MPWIDELVDIVGQTQPKWFTCLDLMRGYHQVKMSEDSKPKTAFTGALSVQMNAIQVDEHPSNLSTVNVPGPSLRWAYMFGYFNCFL